MTDTPYGDEQPLADAIYIALQKLRVVWLIEPTAITIPTGQFRGHTKLWGKPLRRQDFVELDYFIVHIPTTDYIVFNRNHWQASASSV